MYSADFWLSRSLHPGLRSPFRGISFNRGSPFNRSRHSRHRFDECTNCCLDPLTRHHICQRLEAEQCLEIGRLSQSACDCLQCSFTDSYGYEDGLYFAGHGRGFSRRLGDNSYGHVGGRGSLCSRLGGLGGLGGLGMHGYGRFGGVGGFGRLRDMF